MCVQQNWEPLFIVSFFPPNFYIDLNTCMVFSYFGDNILIIFIHFKSKKAHGCENEKTKENKNAHRSGEIEFKLPLLSCVLVLRRHKYTHLIWNYIHCMHVNGKINSYWKISSCKNGMWKSFSFCITCRHYQNFNTNSCA